MRSLIVAAFLAVGPALADEMIAKSGKDYMRLSQNPCTLKLQHAEKLREGSAYLDGVHYSLCWLVHGDGLVYAFYEDGDMGAIPITSFRLEKGV